jgi:hypothetical protein
MNLNDCLNAIIDDGIEAARADYAKPHQADKREGSVKGFEDCRGKAPDEIARLLIEANERAWQAMREQASDYWYWRCRAAEIEWVANVLSNIMHAQGWPPISMMTARGAMKAAEIIGVAQR